MTDTSNAEPVEQIDAPEPTEFERLLATGDDLSFLIGTTSRLNVAWALDPQDLADGTGTPQPMLKYAEHVVIYEGTKANGTPVAITHVDNVGHPGSIAFDRAAKMFWTDDQGAVTYTRGTARKPAEINVAAKPSAIERSDRRANRKNAARLTRLRDAAAAAGDTDVVALYNKKIAKLEA